MENFSLGSVPVSDSGKTFSNSNGSTTILLDELLCIGTESSLLNCSHAPLGMNDCNHKELAGVRCDGMKIRNHCITVYIPDFLAPPIHSFCASTTLLSPQGLVIAELRDQSDWITAFLTQFSLMF